MITRRHFIAMLGSCFALLVPGFVGAKTTTPGGAQRALTGGAKATRDRVTLTMPGIAENGLSVFTTVEVASPMSAQDYVKTIHLLAEKNPREQVASFHLGPRAGRAKVATNIRLAASQQVTALVEMNDGSFWFDTRDVVVTIAACVDSG